MRGELERLLQDQLPPDVSIRFGTTVEAVRQQGERVIVQLSDGSREAADLVAGADGVHSKVRRLVFGGEDRFERFLGYHTAAAILDEPLIKAPADAFSILTEPRRQVGVYPIRGGRMASFFVHAAGHGLKDRTTAAARRELRAVYGDLDWLVPELLERCDRPPEIYLDDVSQIELPAWSRGRVVLVGDACQCVSLLAGQGASIAMAGAYVLAQELADDEVGPALARYELRLRPSVERTQRAGRQIARWFVPETALRRALRDTVLRAATWPLASGFLKRQIAGRSIFRD